MAFPTPQAYGIAFLLLTPSSLAQAANRLLIDPTKTEADVITSIMNRVKVFTKRGDFDPDIMALAAKVHLLWTTNSSGVRSTLSTDPVAVLKTLDVYTDPPCPDDGGAQQFFTQLLK